MEYLKVAEGRSSPKREFRVSRARNQRAMRNNILDAIAQVSNGDGLVSGSDGGEDGVVRMKIVVKKQDLKQMLEVIRGGKNTGGTSTSVSPTPSLCLEQRLNLMRRRHQWRVSQAKGSRRSSWRPALQSIPEEL
ncbi:hypothetical protein ACSBR1_020202 [Camellia fascicularis]